MEAFEDAFLFALRNTLARIGNGKYSVAVGIYRTLYIDASRICKLHGISNHTFHYGCQALVVALNGLHSTLVAEVHLYPILRARHMRHYVVHQFLYGYGFLGQLCVTALVFRHLQELVQHLCHVCGLTAYDIVILSLFVVRQLDVRVRKQLHKTEYLIQRCAYLVRHVLYERVLHVYCFVAACLLLIADVLRPLAIFIHLYSEIFEKLLAESPCVAESARCGNLFDVLIVLQHFKALHKSHFVRIDIFGSIVACEAQSHELILLLHHLIDCGNDGLVTSVHLTVEQKQHHYESQTEHHQHSQSYENVLMT